MDLNDYKNFVDDEEPLEKEAIKDLEFDEIESND